jgi:asparagine synthase (glutamine-hydrolysing)
VDSRVVAQLVAADPAVETTAFTAVFPEHPEFDEHAAAAAAAAALGLRHETLPVQLPVAELPRIIAELDEPLADPSCLPTWALCRAAAQHITVALGGDGGDELFAGYKRYAQHLRARHWRWLRLPAPARFTAAAPLLKATSRGRWERLRLERQLRWEDAYVLRFSGIDPATRGFLQPDFPVREPHYWRLPAAPLAPLAWLLECDRLNYLPEYVLRKTDLCGMAHGLEWRAPLLDHVFWQSVLALPEAERFTTPAKGWLRAQAGLNGVSAKRGFNPPLAAWLRTPAVAESLAALPETLGRVTGGQVAAEPVRKLLAQWQAGRAAAEHVWQLWVLGTSLRSLGESA